MFVLYSRYGGKNEIHHWCRPLKAPKLPAEMFILFDVVLLSPMCQDKMPLIAPKDASTVTPRVFQLTLTLHVQSLHSARTRMVPSNFEIHPGTNVIKDVSWVRALCCLWMGSPSWSISGVFKDSETTELFDLKCRFGTAQASAPSGMDLKVKSRWCALMEWSGPSGPQKVEIWQGLRGQKLA